MQREDMSWLERELETLSRDLEDGGSRDTTPLVIAIDQGGHASRAVAFTCTGRPVGEAFASVATRRDASDRVEHDAEEIVASVFAVLQDLAESLGPDVRRVVACGLATQRSSIVCWDRVTGEALSPVISWQDRRHAAWLETLRMHAERIREITGLVLSPHYGASKMRWCLDELPRVAAAHRRGRLAMGPLASFLASRLVADRPPVVDPANASRTLLWDPASRAWSSELLQLFGVPIECLPGTVPSRYDYGAVPIGPGGIPLAVVTGDQSAAAFARGWPSTDTVRFNVGTGGFLLCALEHAPPTSVPLLRSVLWADEQRVTFGLEGTINGAGSALDWLADQLAIDPQRATAALDRQRLTDTDVPLFVNAISGLGSPYWLPQAQSGFIGASDDFGKVAAVVESIAFLARTNVDAMRAVSPELARIEITGGLAAADYLCQALADITGLPVDRLASVEATAAGLAFLTADAPDAWRPEPVLRRFEPAPDPDLLERYVRWQHAMQKLVPLHGAR